MLVAAINEDAVRLWLGVEDLGRLAFDNIVRVDRVDRYLGARIGSAEQMFASPIDVDVGHLIDQWRRVEMGELPAGVVDGEHRHRIRLTTQLRVNEAFLWASAIGKLTSDVFSAPGTGAFSTMVSSPVSRFIPRT
jgi:hypothetical protein